MNTKSKPLTQKVTDLFEGRWGRHSGVTARLKQPGQLNSSVCELRSIYTSVS
ncbi:hypothetical protein I79_007639 [Cricetulus griseus]|uniref:Uncharacterized protein n=1 Tax=Cricetulus griseus TaxID=10029 RepID=G3HB24_CRIGR|nr:hypothetical protein I79_007639 [Cricetulus griseus]